MDIAEEPIPPTKNSASKNLSLLRAFDNNSRVKGAKKVSYLNNKPETIFNGDGVISKTHSTGSVLIQLLTSIERITTEEKKTQQKEFRGKLCC